MQPALRIANDYAAANQQWCAQIAVLERSVFPQNLAIGARPSGNYACVICAYNHLRITRNASSANAGLRPAQATSKRSAAYGILVNTGAQAVALA